MQKVFVCSPYRGDVLTNVRRAQDMCRELAKRGYAPYAPHLYLPGCLDDANEQERSQGIQVGLAYLATCDLLAFLPDIEPTEGMKAEIAEARCLGIEVIEFPRSWLTNSTAISPEVVDALELVFLRPPRDLMAY